MAVDYQIPSWQNPDTSEGAVLARILAQRRQQQQEQQRIGLERQQVGMEGQRLQAELQQAAQARTEAARKAALRQQYSAAFSALNPNNPDYAAQARALALRMAIDMGGNVSGNMLPPAPRKPPIFSQVPIGQNPNLPPSPNLSDPKSPGTASINFMFDPNTGKSSFPAALNPKPVRDFAAELAEKKRESDAKIAAEQAKLKASQAPPQTKTINGVNFYSTPQGWKPFPTSKLGPATSMTPDAQRNSDWRAAVANLKNIDTQLQDTTLTDDQKKALQQRRAKIQAWIDSVTPMIESPTNQPSGTPSVAPAATNAPASNFFIDSGLKEWLGGKQSDTTPTNNFRYDLQTQDLVPAQ